MRPMEIQPGTVRVRHIKQVPAGTAGATQVLAAWYLPQPEEGLNATSGGFVRGDYEHRVGEEGTFTLVVPNAPGGDGVQHRDRFLVITEKRAYRPGREWLEVYLDDDLLYVGTPTAATITRTTITISGADCLELLKKVRETQAGFHALSPRDGFEFYTEAWGTAVADPTVYELSATPGTTT